ncbi:hypothetical protein [Orlajensenia flava]|uniref:hypothetical protein n=1 Tax=Orlajensenia flava TaxID=2565934 RepID=UPI001F47F775|nr:hypothetical protein [Glaciibacter flavus]
MTAAYWVCALITLVSAFVSLGYSLAALRGASGDVLTASRYAAARSAALAVAVVVALFVGSVAFVAAIAVAMVIVQAIDAVIGVTIKDRLKTFGPAATALFNLAALIWMLLA